LLGCPGAARLIPGPLVTREPSAGQARTGNGTTDIRRRLTGSSLAGSSRKITTGA